MTDTIIIPKRRMERGNTAAALTALNEVLLDREWCIETDTGKVKVGDGVTAYNSLPYVGELANLGNPPGDRLVYWDDAAQQFAFLALGTGLTIGSGGDLDATGGGGGGSAPTGTGLYGVTGGVMDPAAVTIGSGLSLAAGVLSASGGGGGGVVAYSDYLGASNVTVSGTTAETDVTPGVLLPAGTYVAFGQLTCTTASGQTPDFYITDGGGVNYYSSTTQTISSGGAMHTVVLVAKPFTLASPTTIKVRTKLQITNNLDFYAKSIRATRDNATGVTYLKIA